MNTHCEREEISTRGKFRTADKPGAGENGSPEPGGPMSLHPGCGSRDRQLVRNYLTLRKAVGIIGVALPFVLVCGGMLTGSGLQTSLSRYYHTHMGDVFVGSLCAIAVFMWSYRGYDFRDRIAANLACCFGLGVALFPVAPSSPTPGQKILETLHCLSAAGFFCVLAGFSLLLFRLTDRREPGRMKRMRNRVYTVCGYGILACMAGIGIAGLPAVQSVTNRYNPVFWLESLAVFAFGASWFIKGRTLLKDSGR